MSDFEEDSTADQADDTAAPEESEDFYGQRLAAVNLTNPVVASENIFNKSGVLILAAGTVFSESRAEIIAKHKLIKPLEHSIDVSQSISANDLCALSTTIANTVPGLQPFIDDEDVQKEFKKFSNYYERYPLLRQKLTVLSSQLPEIYFNSVYSAMAGVLLARELNLEDQQQRVIFIAGLMHNTGFLHLNPELTRNEAELEQDESLRVQVHPVIAKHFLDNVPGLPKSIGDAVADHHERTDGTGYPKNKFGEELSIESQVLAFTDTMINAYHRCAPYEGNTPELMLMIMQFNNNVHFESVFKAATRLVKLSPSIETPPQDAPTAREIIKQQERFTEVFDATKKLGFVLMKNTRSRLTKSIASMLGRLANSIISAGIMQDEYHAWLEEMCKSPNPEEDLALLKTKMMLDEIEEQLERFKSIMWKAIKKIPKEEELLVHSVTSSYQQLDKIKERYND